MIHTILGIDPGSRITGFGLIRAQGDKLTHIEHGVIDLQSDDILPHRLDRLFNELNGIFRRHSINCAVVEKVFFGKNADSAFKLGQARGVCLLAAAQNQVPIEEFAARYVKKCVTGSGSAAKDHVQLMVFNMLGLKPQAMKFDATDALALAITQARMSDSNARIKALLKEEMDGSL